MSTLVTTMENAARTARLTVARPDGGAHQHELRAGESVLVGSGERCSLRLPSPDVAALHCWIRFTDGHLLVQDWYSSTGTLVDGRPIAEETVVPSGSEIGVGGYRIRVELTGSVEHASPRASGVEEPAAAPASEPAAFSPVAPETVKPAALEAVKSQAPAFDTVHPQASETVQPETSGARLLEFELDSARLEIERLQSELRRLRASAARVANTGPARSVDEETLELLRAEVEQLQSELADRDARLAEVTELADGDATGWGEQPSISESQTAALVDRLEQLLDELARSDDRVATLEELLRLAEDSQRADQEERQQLEAWVGEIENRVAQRESEWQAENEVLRRQLAEAIQQREQTESELANSADHGGAEQSEVLKRLQQHNGELQSRVHAAEQRSARLESELAAARKVASDDIVSARMDEQLREERLQLSQERAELARMRAELARQQAADAEGLAGDRHAETKQGDERVRALRQHLKEIHVEESQQRSERGLSVRLSRLWKRLDS